MDIRRTRIAVLSFPIALAFTFASVLPARAAIDPGDTLFVKVWNHPELSKQITVDANGGARIPLSGVVAVGGLDESAAAEKFADALRPYVQYPAVDVETIDQGKTLFVSGGPVGMLKYQPGETLAAAVADAMQTSSGAGQTLNAQGQNTTRSYAADATAIARIDLSNVKVRRNGQDLGAYDAVAFGATGNPGPLLEPGDTIVFTYKPIDVRVMGDVGRPGDTYLSEHQSLSEAIAQAGGLLPTSASNHVLLERNGQTRSLALGDPAFAAPAENGDVVTIPSAPRVNVVGTVATPGLVALRTDPTLLSAMYTAGGPTKNANLRDVQVVRGTVHTTYDVTKLTHGDMSQNPVLQDGDTVVVPEGHNFDWSGIFGILGGIAAGLASRVPL